MGAFDDMMPHTIQVEPMTDRTDSGKRVFGGAATYRALVTGSNRLVRTADGQLVVAATQINIAGSATIRPEDRITLPEGSQPTILAVRSYSDETGPVHNVEVFCG